MNQRNQNQRPMLNIVHVREYGAAEPVMENGKPVIKRNGEALTRRKAQFHQLGVAFPNDDGETYDCIFYAFPAGALPEANGGVRVKLMKPKPREGEEQQRGGRRDREPERAYRRPQGGGAQPGGFQPDPDPFNGEDNPFDGDNIPF